LLEREIASQRNARSTLRGGAKLLRATIWLSDIRTVDDMNKVWDAWVPAGCAPARACIEALLQGPEKKIEIQVTAAR
jgi:enamine deaminase RidA (YjgF/YER057c/UK114 family)